MALAVGSPKQDETQQKHVGHDRGENRLWHKGRWT
jgi:hypothetical protein